MNESLLPTRAPALDEPLEMLEACHERIESQLKTLERLAAHLPGHGADAQARQAAAAILRYFDLAGPNHHEDEEQDLFPLLVARAGSADAPQVRALIGELLGEHVQMAAAVSAVRRQLVPIAEGHGGDLENACVQRMASLYRSHIEKENTILLPLAQRLLRASDVDCLSRAMTARRSQKS